MTQHCTYDERLLDFVYEEMSAEEAAAFSTHLEGCAACRRHVEQYRRVRTAFHELPAVEPGDAALQRMTAHILHQAAAQKIDKPAVQTLGSTRDLPSAEVGKLLQFRKRRVISMLLHPATGIMAAAALALVFVMTRQLREQVLPERPAPPAAVRPAAPAPAATPAAPAGEADKDFDGLAKNAGPALLEEPVGGAQRPARKAVKKMPVWADAPEKEPLLAVQSEGYQEKKTRLAPGAGRAGVDSLGAVVKSDEAGKREREALAQARPAEAPPPPAQAAQQPTAPADKAEGRQEPVQATEVAEATESFRQRVASTQRDDLKQAVARGKSRQAQAPAATPSPEEAAAPLLRKYHELLAKGLCREAAEVRSQIETRHHGTEIPAEDQKLYAQKCALPNAQNADAEVAAEQQAPLQQLPAKLMPAQNRAYKRAAPPPPPKTKTSKPAATY